MVLLLHFELSYEKYRWRHINHAFNELFNFRRAFVNQVMQFIFFICLIFAILSLISNKKDTRKSDYVLWSSDFFRPNCTKCLLLTQKLRPINQNKKLIYKVQFNETLRCLIKFTGNNLLYSLKYLHVCVYIFVFVVVLY